MEKTNHWSDQNTTALIEGISGIAGNIINKKNSGAQISSAEQQIANLSQQTLQALGLANQQQQIQPQPKGLSGTTMLLVGGGVIMLIVLVLIFKSRK